MTGPDGEVDITDFEYYEHFGDPLPQEPEFHDAGLKAWSYFWRLNTRRPPGFESPAAISYSEIRNWSELTRTFISPEEVELITAMDDAYLKAVQDGMALRRKREERKSKKGK